MRCPSKPRHARMKQVAPASRRQRHARAPFDALERADVGEEALPAAIDEEVAAEAVPDALEHEDAVIDIGDAAVLLDGRGEPSRHDLHVTSEPRAEPPHEAV